VIPDDVMVDKHLASGFDETKILCVPFSSDKLVENLKLLHNLN